MFRCDSSEAYYCEQFCRLMSDLVGWAGSAMEAAVGGGRGGVVAAVDRANYFAEIVATAYSFLHQPFVALCLYFNDLQHPGNYQLAFC